MRTTTKLLVLGGTLCALCAAQQWEVGVHGGAGFLNNLPIRKGSGSVDAGFRSSGAVGGFVAHNSRSHWGGEFHYNYLPGDLKLSGGGTEAIFKGVSHAAHYDLVFRTARRNSRVQAFVAVGGGVKMFQGTGREAAFQPLSDYAYLTKTRTFRAMGSVGAGLKVSLTPSLFLRTEFRDYITSFPTEVITPAPGAKVGSVLHQFVPLVGISYTF